MCFEAVSKQQNTSEGTGWQCTHLSVTVTADSFCVLSQSKSTAWQYPSNGAQLTRGRGHDGLVNCVRAAMSKSVSISKTFVAANAIYSHKFASHDALVSTLVATYDDSPVIFSVVGISRNR